MSVTIGNVEFDRVKYDAGADVLYLHRGEPADAVDFDESPEGHHLRFDRDGHLVGLTIVRPRWLLENESGVTIGLPEPVSLPPAVLSSVLAAA